LRTVRSPFAVHINRCSGLLTLAEPDKVPLGNFPLGNFPDPVCPDAPKTASSLRASPRFHLCSGPEKSRQTLCPWPIGATEMSFRTLQGGARQDCKLPRRTIPKLGRLRQVRQGLVLNPESKTKCGGKYEMPAEICIAGAVSSAGIISESLWIRKPNSQVSVSSSGAARGSPKTPIRYARKSRVSGGSLASRMVFLPVFHMVDESKD
jgi:hypothetical protein